MRDEDLVPGDESRTQEPGAEAGVAGQGFAGAPAGPPPAPPEPGPRSAGFVFTGDAGEYFRIWVVNACLTLVTLGIWSAWAKVRNTQYLRAHTTLDGMPFTYDANPVAILRGRIVAVTAFGIWTALAYIAPLAQLALLLPAAFVVPWLIVASLRFNARVTTYRNVGFTFSGGYGDALGFFVVAPVMSAFTLYLLIPWVVFRQRAWQAEKTAWGNLGLRLQASAGAFYAAHIPAIVVFIVGIVALGTVVGISVATAGDAESMPPWSIALMAIVYIVMLLGTLITHASLVRLTLDSLRVGAHARVHCTVDPMRYAWIMASNTICTILSLGMLYPWGEIRRLRYLAGGTSVSGLESFDEVTGSRATAGSAAGEEIADAFDIDVGF